MVDVFEAAADRSSDSAEEGRIILSPGGEIFWIVRSCCGDWREYGREARNRLDHFSPASELGAARDGRESAIALSNYFKSFLVTVLI